MLLNNMTKTIQLNQPEKVIAFLQTNYPLLFSHPKIEYCLALYVNCQLLLQQAHLIAIGQIKTLDLELKKLLQLGLDLKATGFILIHNHPSEDPVASPADVQVTKAIFHAAQLVKLKLIDHLIVTPNDYFSFWETSLI